MTPGVGGGSRPASFSGKRDEFLAEVAGSFYGEMREYFWPVWEDLPARLQDSFLSFIRGMDSHLIWEREWKERQEKEEARSSRPPKRETETETETKENGS